MRSWMRYLGNPVDDLDRQPEYGIWLSPDVARVDPDSIEGCLFMQVRWEVPTVVYRFSDRRFADQFSAWLKEQGFPHRLGTWGTGY
jgi:hypothetical protein